MCSIPSLAHPFPCFMKYVVTWSLPLFDIDFVKKHRSWFLVQLQLFSCTLLHFLYRFSHSHFIFALIFFFFPHFFFLEWNPLSIKFVCFFIWQDRPVCLCACVRVLALISISHVRPRPRRACRVALPLPIRHGEEEAAGLHPLRCGLCCGRALPFGLQGRIGHRRTICRTGLMFLFLFLFCLEGDYGSGGIDFAIWI